MCMPHLFICLSFNSKHISCHHNQCYVSECCIYNLDFLGLSLFYYTTLIFFVCSLLGLGSSNKNHCLSNKTFLTDYIITVIINDLITYLWSISQSQSYNTRAKKRLAITRYRIGVCTRPTLIVWEKHFNSTLTVASFTHHNAGTQ